MYVGDLLSRSFAISKKEIDAFTSEVRFTESPDEPLSYPHHMSRNGRRQISHRFRMNARHYQEMSEVDGPNIQKCAYAFIPVDETGWRFIGKDSAKNTLTHGVLSIQHLTVYHQAQRASMISDD